MNRRDFISGMAAMAAASRLEAQDFEASRVVLPSIPVFAHYCTWHNAPWRRDQVATMPYRHEPEFQYGYTSTTPSIIQQHNAEMLANGIMPMMSWWEHDTYAGDNFLDKYFPVGGAHPKGGILYEATDPRRFVTLPNGEIDFNDERNASKFIWDMGHLQDKYFGPYKDRFFLVDGKPVVFIWISHIFNGDFAKVVERARERSNFYLIGSNFHVPLRDPKHLDAGLEKIVGGMDAISSYGVYDWRFYGDRLKHSSDKNKDFFADYGRSVSNWSAWLDRHSPRTKIMLPMAFMYDDRHIENRKADGDDAFWSDDATARDFAEMVRGLITQPCGSGRILPFAYITSYNEHYEGTGIEPSEEYGSSYLDIIRETFTPPFIVDREDRELCRPDNPRR